MGVVPQRRFVFKRDRSASIYKLTNEHARVNLEIARGILGDIERHGGPGSGLVVWAEIVVAKAGHFQLEACR